MKIRRVVILMMLAFGLLNSNSTPAHAQASVPAVLFDELRILFNAARAGLFSMVSVEELTVTRRTRMFIQNWIMESLVNELAATAQTASEMEVAGLITAMNHQTRAALVQHLAEVGQLDHVLEIEKSFPTTPFPSPMELSEGEQLLRERAVDHPQILAAYSKVLVRLERALSAIESSKQTLLTVTQLDSATETLERIRAYLKVLNADALLKIEQPSKQANWLLEVDVTDQISAVPPIFTAYSGLVQKLFELENRGIASSD